MGEHNCKLGPHRWLIMGRPHFKLDGRNSGVAGLPSYDQSVSYQRIYCEGCGESKEVIAADHRQVTS